MAPKAKKGRASSASSQGEIQIQPPGSQVGGKQTQEERREIRVKYRDLGTAIGTRTQALQELHGQEFEEAVDKHDELFDKVQHPREAVLDTANWTELSKVPLQQIELLANATARYNPDKFLEALLKRVQSHNNHVLDWRKLGAMVSPCFRSVPELDFMYGPLDKPLTERKERAKRKRYETDDVEESHPDKVETNAEDDETSGATAARIKRLETLLCKYTEDATVRRQHGKDVDMFDLCFNTESFTQTVENLFDLSFMVNRSQAEITVDKETSRGRVLKLEGEEEAKKSKHQAILSLTMKDWQDIVHKFGVNKSLIPTREGYDKDPHVDRWIAEKEETA